MSHFAQIRSLGIYFLNEGTTLPYKLKHSLGPKMSEFVCYRHFPDIQIWKNQVFSIFEILKVHSETLELNISCSRHDINVF